MKRKQLPKRILNLPTVDLLTSEASFDYGYEDYYFSTIHYHKRFDGILRGYPYSIFLVENPKTGVFSIANYSTEHHVSEKLDHFYTKREANAGFKKEIAWIKQNAAKPTVEFQ